MRGKVYGVARSA